MLNHECRWPVRRANVVSSASRMRGDDGSLWLSSFGEIGHHNCDYRERKAFFYCEKELSGAQFGFIRL
jgi:hypothetical protein